MADITLANVSLWDNIPTTLSNKLSIYYHINVRKVITAFLSSSFFVPQDGKEPAKNIKIITKKFIYSDLSTDYTLNDQPPDKDQSMTSLHLHHVTELWQWAHCTLLPSGMYPLQWVYVESAVHLKSVSIVNHS